MCVCVYIYNCSVQTCYIAACVTKAAHPIHIYYFTVKPSNVTGYMTTPS